MRSHPAGQAFLEFTLSLVLLVAPSMLIAKLLLSQWNHTRCLYLLFEQTHSQRAGQGRPTSPMPEMPSREISISVTENDDEFHGEGHCGQAHEQITLPKLEAASW